MRIRLAGLAALLLAALTVAGCMLTVFLAVTHPDHLVRDSATVSPQPENAAREPVR